MKLLIVWVLHGFVMGHPIKIDDIETERQCRTIAVSIGQAFRNDANVMLSCNSEIRMVGDKKDYE